MKVAVASGDSWVYFESENEISNFNQRQIGITELILETDYPESGTNEYVARHISKSLCEKKISHSIWFSGNKSFHLHCNFSELEKYEYEARTRIRNLLAQNLTNEAIYRDLDKNNFCDKRMIGAENKPHRHTGQLKTMVSSFDFGTNKIPNNVLELFAIKNQLNVPFIPKKFNGKCKVCELYLVKSFPDGGRYQNVLPNFVSIMPHTVWEQAAKTKKQSISKFTGWATQQRNFNCGQLQKYSKSISIWNDTCRICPHRRILNES